MALAGRRALGGRHLVELIDEEQLARVNPGRVLARVRRASGLLEAALAARAKERLTAGAGTG